MAATPEALKAQISSTEDLQSVVKTMKALAAVSIRQYQRAVESLFQYNRTVEMGLQIVLKQQYFNGDSFAPLSQTLTQSAPTGRVGILIFGSDQGLCGQFNEQIASHALEQIEALEIPEENQHIAAVGARVLPILEANKKSIETLFSVPSSATGITAVVQDILVTLQQWRFEQQVHRVILFYNKSTSGASYQPRQYNLLPLDGEWLNELENREWPTSMMPIFTMDWEALFSALIRQYLFVSLFRALAESLASENASRLSSMQAAEKNIRERLSDLTAQYRRERQSSITGELLDIASGFEALTSGE